MAKAPERAVWTTPELVARSRTAFDVTALEPLTLKGKASPVEAVSVGAVGSCPGWDVAQAAARRPAARDAGARCRAHPGEDGLRELRRARRTRRHRQVADHRGDLRPGRRPAGRGDGVRAVRVDDAVLRVQPAAALAPHRRPERRRRAQLDRAQRHDRGHLARPRAVGPATRRRARRRRAVDAGGRRAAAVVPPRAPERRRRGPADAPARHADARPLRGRALDGRGVLRSPAPPRQPRDLEAVARLRDAAARAPEASSPRKACRRFRP